MRVLPASIVNELVRTPTLPSSLPRMEPVARLAAVSESGATLEPSTAAGAIFVPSTAPGLILGGADQAVVEVGVADARVDDLR